jgi:hypothetical protein
MKKKVLAMLIVGLFCIVFAAFPATKYKVVVPKLAPANTEAYNKLITAVLEATGNSADTEVVPFARALYLMENKQADILSSIVAIPDKAKWGALNYDYSTVDTVKIVFILYTKKGSTITVDELKRGNPNKYKLETDAGHINHFNIAINPSSNPDASLQKVDRGLIDGYIFSQGSGDVALKRLALKTIKRQYFDTFNGVFVLKKGSRGSSLDKLLSDGMEKIKKNGKYDEIMGNVVAGASTYIEWQP